MLVLLPNILYEEGWHDLPISLADFLSSVDLLLAESEKGGRRYLRHFKRHLPIEVFGKYTTNADIEFFLKEMREGKTLGLLSDAGLPAIADPGSSLVEACHREKIGVRALSGPCSITLGWMLSGFSANRFSFHGYLPKNLEEKTHMLARLERTSAAQKSAEMFIETPYRNASLFACLLECLDPETQLFIGKQLGSPQAYALSQSIRKWKKTSLIWNKEPTIFILYRGHFFPSQAVRKFANTTNKGPRRYAGKKERAAWKKGRE
ncbi:MAG: SAM-dependent methyltransferase [Chlamydiota bacterium]